MKSFVYLLPFNEPLKEVPLIKGTTIHGLLFHTKFIAPYITLSLYIYIFIFLYLLTAHSADSDTSLGPGALNTVAPATLKLYRQ